MNAYVGHKFWYVLTTCRTLVGVATCRPCCVPVEILVRVAYLQKFWYVLSTCRSMVLDNYLQNFDKRRYLQESGMCCLPAEVLYLPATCTTLTSVATCRNLVCAVYLQKYGTWQLPAELWQASLLAEIWYVLSTCRSIVFANYLQNFDRRRYLQKCGMCYLPAKNCIYQLPAELWQASLLAEIWYVLSTYRSMVLDNYL